MLERVMRAIGVKEAAEPILVAEFLRRALAPAGVRVLTAAALLVGDDFYVECDATGAAFAPTLPAASNVKGHVFAIKRINGGANNVTVTPNGAETIDGAATLVLNAQNQSRLLFSNGANWKVIGGYL